MQLTCRKRILNLIKRKTANSKTSNFKKCVRFRDGGKKPVSFIQLPFPELSLYIYFIVFLLKCQQADSEIRRSLYACQWITNTLCSNRSLTQAIALDG